MISTHELSSPVVLPDPGAPLSQPRVLLLGVGNWLMGDEGVGIHVIHHLETQPPLFGVRVLDGGTGGINLLLEFERVTDVVMVDATRDGRPAGTITFLQPRRVGDLPRGLGAHDFGVKDLFAAAALLGQMPAIHLYTISVEEVEPMCTELSPAVAAAVPEVVATMHALAARLATETP
ncbi:MAG: hydrogenase maturation protease [Candidatus Didemnitutus sp.]|nr:hydrogenase maturation protease [Candidatus Didemnitutus sp.]